MCKLFNKIFPALLAALFVCALYLTALPSRLTADEIDGWQLRLVDNLGNSSTYPLVADYSQDGIEHTLSDPFIPLRTLADACGARVDFRQTAQYRATIWSADGNPRLFLANQPLSLSFNKEENGAYSVCTTAQFEQPRLLGGQFCVPISYLDEIGLRYKLDAHRLTITVYITPTTPTASDELWQAAENELTRLFTSGRHLLKQFTITTPVNDVSHAQNLLILAGKLHATLIPPDTTLDLSPIIGASSPDYVLRNDTIFPWQISCRTNSTTLTIKLWELNSLAVAEDYLGQIAE